jgi:hypothetical protein
MVLNFPLIIKAFVVIMMELLFLSLKIALEIRTLSSEIKTPTQSEIKRPVI